MQSTYADTTYRWRHRYNFRYGVIHNDYSPTHSILQIHQWTHQREAKKIPHALSFLWCSLLTSHRNVRTTIFMESIILDLFASAAPSQFSFLCLPLERLLVCWFLDLRLGDGSVPSCSGGMLEGLASAFSWCFSDDEGRSMSRKYAVRSEKAWPG